jgi:hypothetical protein
VGRIKQLRTELGKTWHYQYTACSLESREKHRSKIWEFKYRVWKRKENGKQVYHFYIQIQDGKPVKRTHSRGKWGAWMK